MEVGKFEFKRRGGLTLSASLGIAIFVSGCAESGGYEDYSALPNHSSQMPRVEAVVENVDTPKASPNDSATATSAKVASKAADQQPVTVVSGDLEKVTTEPDGGSEPSTPPVKDTATREMKLLIPEKSFPAIKGSDAVRVSYDDLDLEKILNIIKVPPEAVDRFPAWLTELDGKKVRMRGFMYPTFKAEGLTGFVFTRDTGVCCFGPDPYIFLRAKVKLAKGESTDYIHMKPFDVEGVFRIVPLADDDGLWQLYRIEDARVL